MPPSHGAELALLLLGGFHSMVDEVVPQLEARGHAGVTPVHEFALRAIDGGADTASELGRRLSVSKQAAAKTITALEQLGYVAREAERIGMAVECNATAAAMVREVEAGTLQTGTEAIARLAPHTTAAAAIAQACHTA